MSYDPKLKHDNSLIMSALGALCLDAADRFDRGDDLEIEADRNKHKLIALKNYDDALTERSEQLLRESILEQVRHPKGSSTTH